MFVDRFQFFLSYTHHENIRSIYEAEGIIYYGYHRSDITNVKSIGKIHPNFFPKLREYRNFIENPVINKKNSKFLLLTEVKVEIDSTSKS